MTWVLSVFEILVIGWLAPVFWLVFVASLYYKFARLHHG